RQRDALTRRRMALPWERVEKSYRFEGPNGARSLADLFEGRSQLIVYHFMLGPDWEEGCKSCSFWADNFNGIPIHLNHRDVRLRPFHGLHWRRLTLIRSAWAGASRGFRHTEAISISTTRLRLRQSRSLRAWRITITRLCRIRCRSRLESASSTRMTVVRCSTLILATRAAWICSTAPTTISISLQRAVTRTASNSRWNGSADTISIE